MIETLLTLITLVSPLVIFGFIGWYTFGFFKYISFNINHINRLDTIRLWLDNANSYLDKEWIKCAKWEFLGEDQSYERRKLEQIHAFIKIQSEWDFIGWSGLEPTQSLEMRQRMAEHADDNNLWWILEPKKD